MVVEDQVPRTRIDVNTVKCVVNAIRQLNDIIIVFVDQLVRTRDNGTKQRK